MTDTDKLRLDVKQLFGFLRDNFGILSNMIPKWLMQINNGYADPDIFENASDFKTPDEVINVFEGALTALWFTFIVNNKCGENAFESNMFEANRQGYIEVVKQRLDTINDIKLADVNKDIKVASFPVLWPTEVFIKLEKSMKTADEIAMTLTEHIKNMVLSGNDAQLEKN